MTMLTRSDLNPRQEQAIEFIIENPNAALFAQMGAGKTVITLTATQELIRTLDAWSVLIIAPLKVANTVWKQEAAKWEHLQELDIRICTGTAKERMAALTARHDIHVINRENVQWMVDNVPWQWDMVIIDESSSFKSHNTKRFKSLRSKGKEIHRTVLLTGTPSPNSLMDLWSQLYLLDRGKRLCPTITMFRDRYFYRGGFQGHTYNPQPHADKAIKKRIEDICLTMPSSYKDKPQMLYERIPLPDKAASQYKELKKQFLLTLDNGVDIATPSAAALAGKLLQLCNGAAYDEDGAWHEVHKAKLERLRDIVDDNPSENILVAYNYKSDLARLHKAFPHAVKLSRDGREVKDWNERKIKMLLAHPASAGHGLNLQHGGSMIVWFGLNWSLELYEQFNARLARPGQSETVRIVHLVIDGCMDDNVLKALQSKAKTQQDLLKALKSVMLPGSGGASPRLETPPAIMAPATPT